jgi:hypothetical protein
MTPSLVRRHLFTWLLSTRMVDSHGLSAPVLLLHGNIVRSGLLVIHAALALLCSSAVQFKKESTPVVVPVATGLLVLCCSGGETSLLFVVSH